MNKKNTPMLKQVTNYILIACLVSSSFATPNPGIISTFKSIFQQCARLTRSHKENLIIASLIALSGYVATKSFIAAKKYRSEKLAIQDSLPRLKKYIAEVQDYADEWQDMLGSDFRVSLRYDAIYKSALKHDSDEYKNITRLYAAEKKSTTIASLAVISFVGLCCYLHSRITHPFQ